MLDSRYSVFDFGELYLNAIPFTRRTCQHFVLQPLHNNIIVVISYGYTYKRHWCKMSYSRDGLIHLRTLSLLSDGASSIWPLWRHMLICIAPAFNRSAVRDEIVTLFVFAMPPFLSPFLSAYLPESFVTTARATQLPIPAAHRYMLHALQAD